MEEYIREQLPNNVSMSAPVSQEFNKMFIEMPLYLEDEDPFYHAFPENLQNEDTEKWINIEDDKKVLEAIIDDEMKKEGSSESEATVTPVVTKDVEMTPVGKSLSRNEVLSHISELKITAYNQKLDDMIFYLSRARSVYAAAQSKEGRRSSRQILITEMINKT